jgi:hypothetical protein
LRKLIAFFALCGCASQGVPPGGPPDTEAPKIFSITPDSGRTSVKGGVAVFRFDEVVAERPPSATTLGDLFLVSPRQGVPNVSWHRSSIQLKPRKGWLPNTTYTVTMLPGIADLRGNLRNTGASTFFSTGTTVDNGVITGTVSDLVSGASVPGALVEARAGTDTTVSWIARADTAGGFRLSHLPRKTFTLRAYVDKNKNFGVDPGEPSDSSSAAASDSARVDFLVVARDSIAPRLSSATSVDSVTITAIFDRPTDSASAVNVANYTLIAADSSKIQIVSVSPPRDTLSKRKPLARSIPLSTVTIKLNAPLDPKKTYKLRATGLVGMLGQTMPSEVVVTAPHPAPPPSPKTAPKKPPPNLPTGAVPIPIKHD